ncbi:unnamed protein product, partial [Musa textilis]
TPPHPARTAPRRPRGHGVKLPVPRSRCKVVDINVNHADLSTVPWPNPLKFPSLTSALLHLYFAIILLFWKHGYLAKC